MQKYELNGAQ